MAISFPNYSAASAHPLANDDIVAYVGVTTATGDVRTHVQHSTNLSELVGSGKPFGEEASGNTAAYELTAIMKQWGGEVIALGVANNASVATVNGQVDKLAGYQDSPTIFILGQELAMRGTNGLGGAEAYGNSSIAAHLETVCEQVYGRGVVSFAPASAANDTSPNRINFRDSNRHERIAPCFNPLHNYSAASCALGSSLAAAARFGRGTAVNGFSVDGLGGDLVNLWSPTNSVATSLASGDALVLVNDQGTIEVLSGDDGEFYYDTPVHERYWEVARQVDYVKRGLIHFGRIFLSRGDFTVAGLAAELQSHADSMASHGNARRIEVLPLADGTSGVTRTFHLRIHPYFAIRNLVFRTEVVDTYITL